MNRNQSGKWILPALLAATMVAIAPVRANEMADGEVRKVDRDAEKLTIRHGEIRSLQMSPMTMVFRVKDTSMLDQVKAGDKIKFSVEKIGGQFTVTGIEVAK